MDAIGERVEVDTRGRAALPGPGIAPAARERGLRRVPSVLRAPGSQDAGGAGTSASGAGAVRPEVAASGGGAFAGSTSDGLDSSLSLLRGVGSTAPGDLARAGFGDAADFAGRVEELSRTVEYLQLLAAGAVDRTRKEAANAAPGSAAGWTTGWGNQTAVGSPAPVPSDDGCRNTAEFLRVRLRISIAEARRRLALAGTILPRTGLAGQPMPAEREELAAAIAVASVSSRAGTIITMALDRVRHLTGPDTATAMEHNLTSTAINNDTDFLTRIAKTWTDFIDANGAEPSEEELRHRQGAFIRHPRRGLHHLEIFATQDQFEHLLTVMNAATNPRTRPIHEADTGSGAVQDPDTGSGEETNTSAGTDADADAATDTRARAAATAEASGTGAVTAVVVDADGNDLPAPGSIEVTLDRRTRPQKLLDGLISACKAALTTGNLPTAGGFRPQVTATISYQDLLTRLHHASEQGPRYTRTGTGAATGTGSGARFDSTPGTPGTGGPWADTGTAPTGSPAQDTPGPRPGGGGAGPGTDTGTFTFTGPVTASTIRQLACDADIIPVLLGSAGRVMDIGHTSRIFPPHIRKAITARDQGCAFPNCTMPAPWTEAHHIIYWSHGGTTGTDNGTLLCSHHHHLIHKEQWTIQIQNGIPWFIPPRHIDPHQKPQRNNTFRT
ncbi:HNH endonuclease signature motif containing protein [Micrococcaceae bacterium Sec5.7]